MENNETMGKFIGERNDEKIGDVIKNGLIHGTVLSIPYSTVLLVDVHMWRSINNRLGTIYRNGVR